MKVYITAKCLLFCILALFIPPLPILIMRKCKQETIISLILTILLYLPGLIYSEWYIITHFRSYQLTQHFDF